MFGWEFPPFNSGGLGVACYGLTRGLLKEGAQVTFVLPRKIPVNLPGCTFVFADEAEPTDARLLRSLLSGYLSEEQYRALRERYPELGNGMGLFDEVLRYSALARMVAQGQDFDVIHTHDWLTFLAGMEARAATNKPMVAHVHATEFDRTGHGQINESVYAIERRGMHAADRVVAVSGYTKNMIMDKYGVADEKVAVVHNGIDADDAVVVEEREAHVHELKKAGNSIVLFVGRLTLQKGPDYFLRMAKRVLEYKKDVVFVISGSGDMERQIMDEAAYLGIADRVLFVGFLRNHALARMYAMADLVVMPSVSEPFGIVPLEALLNGTPVLLSKQSGVREVVKNALVADFWDIDEMANNILAVVSHNALQRTLIQGGKQEAQNIQWQRAAARCMMIYKKLLSPTLVPTTV